MVAITTNTNKFIKKKKKIYIKINMNLCLIPLFSLFFFEFCENKKLKILFENIK